MPQNSDQVNESSTTTNHSRNPFKIALIVIGVILMLFVCVTTFILVIPRTNIYRFNDLPQEILDSQIN